MTILTRRGLILSGGALAAVAVTAACSNSATPTGGDANAPSPMPTSNVNEDGTVNDPNAVEVDPNKLVFWSLFAGGDGKFMDQIISDYNGTSPKKQVQSVMLVWADYYTKLMTAVAADKGPDIGVSHMSKLPELVAKGVVQPIDDYAEGAGINWGDYPENSLAGVTYDGQHYAIPLDTHAQIMYGNQDILKEAGIEVDADGKVAVASSDEFIAILTKLKDSVGDGITPLSMPQQGDDPYRSWWAIYFQMGGTPIVSEDGSSLTLDKDAAVKAAEFLNSLYKDGYILPGISDHQQMFQEGNAGLFFGGTWAVGAFEKTDGLNFAPQPFPSLFNGSKACWADAHTLTLPTKKSRSEEDSQASVDFLGYVPSKGGITWASSGQIPSNSTVTADPAYAALEFRSNYTEAKDDAILPPQTESFAALKDTMIKNLNTIWSGQAEPQAAIDNMFDEMESDLS